MTRGQKARVTVLAVRRRANRKLAADGLQLKATRGGQRKGEVDYLLLDLKRNSVTPLKQSLESYARKIGALADWEEINT